MTSEAAMASVARKLQIAPDLPEFSLRHFVVQVGEELLLDQLSMRKCTTHHNDQFELIPR